MQPTHMKIFLDIKSYMEVGTKPFIFNLSGCLRETLDGPEMQFELNNAQRKMKSPLSQSIYHMNGSF